ncbi:hypothetical protein TorRG33x02_153570, partial [Trema orientale]
MSLATLLLIMPPSSSDLLLPGWLSKDGVIGSQTRPNDHKMKTTAKVSDAAVPPSGHLEG